MLFPCKYLQDMVQNKVLHSFSNQNGYKCVVLGGRPDGIKFKLFVEQSTIFLSEIFKIIIELQQHEFF